MPDDDRARLAGAVLTLSGAVAVTTFDDGGFDPGSQALFIALAGAALLAAVTLDGRATVAAARRPLALTLAGIAATALASCLWTIDGVAVALRGGLVVAGLAAVCVAASTLATRIGSLPFVASIAVLALVESILGLHAVAMHALPQAERIYGVWRPGGTFQYPPALATLELCALTALRVALGSPRKLLAGAAAGAAMLAGSVLELSGSRLALAMAALLLILMLVRAAGERSRGAGAIATAACVSVGASLSMMLLGGHVGADAAPAGWLGLLELVALAVCLGVAWTAIRGHALRGGRVAFASGVSIVVIALGGALSVAPWESSRAGGRGTGALAHDRIESSFLHGRGHEWSAALETWADRPLLGAGAGAYAQASAVHQRVAASRFAHDLPLELAAELGILGALLAIALYVTAGKLAIRASSSPGMRLLAPAVVVFLASNLVDWTWHLIGLAAVWALACGALQADGC